MSQNYIAILDFGSQYTHLISRRIRQLGVLAKIFQQDVSAQELHQVGDNGHCRLPLAGIILSGGPASVRDSRALRYDPKIFNLGVPVLGLCYGHQLIAHHFGGRVEPGKTKEYGRAKIAITDHRSIFAGLKTKEQVWMSHWDTVVKLPRDFQVLAKTADCPIAAMVNPKKQIYSFQFHPEVHHTTHGMKILENFIYKVCGLKPDWNVKNYLPEIIQEIKDRVGEKLKVFLLVSGGVDSTVCFALLNKVLGPDRVYGLHVDTGFMRLNESEKINSALIRAGFDNLHIVNARKKFFTALKGIVNPEQKRKIIGRLYLQIQAEMMRKLKLNPQDWLLAQGTIYPDTIEAGGTKQANKIKTHHNRVPEALRLIKAGRLIEPLKNLYKDEVRELGVQLGLDKKLVHRHPFPGPGLAIRILCSNPKSKIKNPKSINQKLSQLILDYNQRYRVKLTAKIIPVKSVGVQGDVRTYRHPAVIQGQTSYAILDKLATEIANSFGQINRVIWLVNPKKADLSKAKVKAKTLTPSRVKLLQKLDDQIMNIIRQNKIYKQIWQFPNVLIPFGPPHRQASHKGESLVMRPIQSSEAMTVNFYRMQPRILKQVIQAVKKFPEIDYLFYDITNKPPATIEWE